MQNQTLDISQGKLIFRTDNGLLHLVDEQSEQILQAFRQGFTIDELCGHFKDDAPPDECRQRISELWQHWKTLNLLDAGATPDPQFPYKLLIKPGKEVIQVITNSQQLFTYLKQFYPLADTSEDRVMIIITIQETKESNTYVVLSGNEKKHQASSMEGAILATCFEIGEQSTYEEPRLFIAHAAALTYGTNVWLLPAESGNGKSTLTATLLKHGYKLINDDIVPINHDGTATALNLPIKIKSGAWSILDRLYPELKQTETILRADKLRMKNLAVPKESLCLAGSAHNITGIIMPTYDPQQQQPLLKPLSHYQKLHGFLQAEPYFPHRLTHPYLKKVVDWLEPIPAWSIRYSDSQQAIQLLQHLSH